MVVGVPQSFSRDRGRVEVTVAALLRMGYKGSGVGLCIKKILLKFIPRLS